MDARTINLHPPDACFGCLPSGFGMTADGAKMFHSLFWFSGKPQWGCESDPLSYSGKATISISRNKQTMPRG
jgi:hypothetical protein